MVGVNLPHIVFQPLEGQVQYKTQDITPVFWFHYTPDILVVPEQSPIKNFADFIKAAKASPGKLSLGGSGQNSANHAAHERLDAAFGVKTIYVPFKGTGDMATSVMGAQVDGAYRGIGVPKSTPPEARKRLSDLWAALNNDPEMKELAAKSGFELVNVGVDQMDASMKEKTKLYTQGAQRLELGKK